MTTTSTQPGARLGAFRLETSVSVGARASRYLASDRVEGASDRFEVRALHTIDAALRTRLKTLKSLGHPGLLPILRLELDDPTGAYVTLRVAQGTWRDNAPSALSGQRAALQELSDALAAAHMMGIVHGAIDVPHVLRGPRGWWLDLTSTDSSPSTARAPELVGTAVATSAADVWALGTLVQDLVKAGGDPELDALLASMTAFDPEARPTAAEVATDLSRTSHAPVPSAGLAPETNDIPARLGPYQLIEKLGEGGMGAVFRARSENATTDVALKVMLPEWSRDRMALARFRREARVLAQLATPHIAQFIAAQRDGAFEYMVMEFVEGRSAHWLLKKRGSFPVQAALAIAIDVCRALAEVHALGLVHRDVKPSNILIAADSDPSTSPRAKLCDFGIVRASGKDDGEVLTQTAQVGTPSYMAPEQVLGREIGASADIYALGATLYTLIVGVPPYVGNANMVMAAHVRDPVPDVREKKPEVDARLAATLMRTLAKSPADRFASTLELLEELEVARGGETRSVAALPQPINLHGAPVVYDFQWDLGSTAEELWPHVSNTERLNRAIGLDDVAWELRAQEEGPTRFGSFRAAGMLLAWKENPFEWVAPHRLGVVREYESGPFQWMRSIVGLAPREGGGTRLTHRIEILPRHLLGRAAASVEIGLRLRRALERTYGRIDAACVAARGSESLGADPFEAPEPLEGASRARLRAAMERVVARGGDAAVAAALEQWIHVAPPQALGRIRPYAWADERRLPRRAVLETFLIAAAEGALAMAWDILCPTCRIPSDLHTSLQALKDHGRCSACALDYEIDLARSVELVFRVDERTRAADVGVYCIGGPAHSPHVVAQVRVERGKRFVLDVKLGEGAYVLRGRDLPTSYRLLVQRDAVLSRWPLSLRGGDERPVRRTAPPGRVVISMINDLDHDVVVRLEDSRERADVVTAAQAASSSLFRRLFPNEVLAPHELIGISHVSLLLAEVPDAKSRYQTEDDRHVHAELVALQREVNDASEREGGAIVKLQLQGVLAVFTDPVAAARAAVRLVDAMKQRSKVAIHVGTAMLTTINERLDYFGRTVHVTSELLDATEAGEITVSEEIQRADSHAVDVVRDAGFDLVDLVQRSTIGLRYRKSVASDVS